MRHTFSECEKFALEFGISYENKQDLIRKVEIMLGDRSDADVLLVDSLRTAYYVKKRVNEISAFDMFEYRNQCVKHPEAAHDNVPPELSQLFIDMGYLVKVSNALDAIRNYSIPVKYRSYIGYLAQPFNMMAMTAVQAGVNFMWLETVPKPSPIAYAEEFSNAYMRLCEAKEYIIGNLKLVLPNQFPKSWKKLQDLYLSGVWNTHFEIKGTPEMFQCLRSVIEERGTELVKLSDIDLATTLFNGITAAELLRGKK